MYTATYVVTGTVGSQNDYRTAFGGKILAYSVVAVKNKFCYR
jgi:hypothetical protein